MPDESVERWTIYFCERCGKITNGPSHRHYRADERGNAIPGSGYEPQEVEVIPLSAVSELLEGLILDFNERAGQAEPPCSCEDPEGGHVCEFHDDDWEKVQNAYLWGAHRLRTVLDARFHNERAVAE